MNMGKSAHPGPQFPQPFPALTREVVLDAEGGGSLSYPGAQLPACAALRKGL
jgi:hypothetical protein